MAAERAASVPSSGQFLIQALSLQVEDNGCRMPLIGGSVLQNACEGRAAYANAVMFCHREKTDLGMCVIRQAKSTSPEATT
jgi:hypothetical protein